MKKQAIGLTPMAFFQVPASSGTSFGYVFAEEDPGIERCEGGNGHVQKNQ